MRNNNTWFINELNRKAGEQIEVTFTNGNKAIYTTNILNLLVSDPIVKTITKNGIIIFNR